MIGRESSHQPGGGAPASPPPYERGTRIFAWIVSAATVVWFGGHLLVGAL